MILGEGILMNARERRRIRRKKLLICDEESMWDENASQRFGVYCDLSGLDKNNILTNVCKSPNLAIFTGSPNETPPGKGRETDLQLPCWLQLTLLG